MRILSELQTIFADNYSIKAAFPINYKDLLKLRTFLRHKKPKKSLEKFKYWYLASNELPQKMHLEKWLDIPGDILSHRENPQSLIPEHNRLE